MATTLTTHQRAARSSVTLKVIMAVTGLILIGFLLMHAFGNFKLLLPDEGKEFNEYSHSLREFLYPILPPMFFLWGFRIFLLVATALHFYSAFKLAGRRWSSAGGSRYVTQKPATPRASSFAARTMLWGGIIIVLFVIMHLLQFTAQVLTFGYPDGTTSLEPYERTVAGFSEWWVVVMYAVVMVVVCVHIFHGFWSAFATLGANVSAKSQRVLRGLAVLVAALLYVGFMIPPVLIVFGVIGQ